MVANVIVAVLVAAFLLWPIGILLQWRALKRQKAATDAANAEVRSLRERLAPVVVIDDEVKRTQGALAELMERLEAALRQDDQLQAEYRNKKVIYDRLAAEIGALENRLDLAEVGYYEPQFSFETSAQYAEALTRVRERQKAMISAESAVTCDANWTVDGSLAKGKIMTRRNIRMTLRAFNNEAEVAIAKVTWKNSDRLAEKVRKSFAAFNDLNKSNKVEISPVYLDLKLEELRLTFEEKQRKQREAEVLREERAREREEAKALREQEAEIKRQEAREVARADALEKARAELEASDGAERDKLQAKVAELESQLEEARAAKERAISMAQQTRVGHVYIISNIGSFGQDVFKIGMTRRVDPMERVYELGDASVPFPFDVHAMIFTEDAPALERRLQILLDQHRVNRVNPRKEFFKVSLEALKDTVRQEFPNAVIMDAPDAEEYFRSLPKNEAVALAQHVEHEPFPQSL